MYSKIFTEILDKIEREAENCDRMDGFQFTHSVSGGTGSGLGSIILEKLRDRYLSINDDICTTDTRKS